MTYVDDEPTLTSAKVTGTNTVTLNSARRHDAFVVSTNGVSNTCEWIRVSGSR